MKGKTLFILVAVSIALAVVAYLNIRANKPVSGVRSEMGRQPFSGLPKNDIAAVAIKSPDGEVLLRKGPSVWEVANRFNFPADFGKITDLIRKISDVKIGRSFQAGPDALARMRLLDPEKTDLPADQRGVRVVMRGADDAVLSELIVGNAREAGSGFGGHYLLDVKAQSVYLADQNFDFIDKTPSGWLSANILEAKSMDVESVTCLAAGGDPDKPLYRLKRPEKGKAPELDPSSADALDTATINNLFGALDGLTIEDVVDPKADLETRFNGAPVLEYRMYDGVVYRITPDGVLADEPEQFYLRVAVDYVEPPKAEKSAPEEKPAEEVSPASEGKDVKPPAEKAKDDVDPAAVKAQAEELQARVGAWTYVIDKWRYEKLVTSKTGLIKKEEKKEEKK